MAKKVLFNDLANSEKMEDPEIRRAAELGRSDKKVRGGRFRKSSVSMNKLRGSMLFVGVVFSIAVIASLGFLIWKAIEIYIGS